MVDIDVDSTSTSTDDVKTRSTARAPPSSVRTRMKGAMMATAAAAAWRRRSMAVAAAMKDAEDELEGAPNTPEGGEPDGTKEVLAESLVSLWSNKPPLSIYSVPVLCTMSTPPEDLVDPYFWGIFLIPYWALAFLAMAAQGFAVIIYVRDIVEQAMEADGGEGDDEGGADSSCPNSKLLRFIALLCFTSVIWSDVFESIKMWVYLWQIPAGSVHTGLDHYRIDEGGNPIGFGRGEGILWWERWVYVFLIILPKMALTCILWYYGCGFLAYSEDDTELLLNAVALIFVIEIDEYIYSGVVPDGMNSGLECFPELSISHDDSVEFGFLHRWAIYGHFVLSGIIIGGVFGSDAIWC